MFPVVMRHWLPSTAAPFPNQLRRHRGIQARFGLDPIAELQWNPHPAKPFERFSWRFALGDKVMQGGAAEEEWGTSRDAFRSSHDQGPPLGIHPGGVIRGP